MSSIAQYLHSKGFKIKGSDLSENKNVLALKEIGIEVHIGHNPQNITNDVAFVIASSAIKEDNPEIIEAIKRSIRVFRRYELLALLFNEKFGIAIAGSHGKTTTTSLATELLCEASLNPAAIIGGRIQKIKQNVMCGNSNFFIAEADESDGGFLLLNPKIAIVTNIDNDHLNYYKIFENEVEAFREFIKKSNYAILNIDDENLSKIANQLDKGRCFTYSLHNKSAHFWAENTIHTGKFSQFVVNTPQGKIDIKLNIPGAHNISNSLAIVGLAHILRIEKQHLQKALEFFSGVDRRFSFRSFLKDNVEVYDDYAHHPKEIEATLQAARQVTKSRVVAIFQPHRYTRVQSLMDEFSKCFRLADIVFLLDIYPAGEKSIEDINSKVLAENINKFSNNCVYIDDINRIKPILLKETKAGDLVITMGAGDITKLSYQLNSNASS
ncbi:UDP-N-acetylmuramate--alanine ligase [Desulfurella amilsii]|uniref:UDP-N-acetylmuramate--L-alanine ligase n=2 Tax=Desulfurella amilsii TaxID=1562698 RepID=A0A1X4XV62_9BACT|nr:UDP-N-acetylmuramate--alanine ligase [Desulfurella amilsii]